MIEFNGYITDSAEKRFHYNNRIMGMRLGIVAWLLVVPSIIVWGVKTQNWLMVGLCGATFFVLPTFVLIPQGKNEKKATIPNNIVINESFIVCKTGKQVESRLLEDVKTVKDYGDFYELVFPFGKISANFICQKNLIVKGTLEEFETIFAGKIIKISC